MREWFELAKLQVRNFTEYDHERQKVEVFRAKLRRRTDRAWRKHVEDTRAARAARMAGRGLPAAPVTEATEKEEDQDAHRRSDTLGAGDGERKDSFALDAVPSRPVPTAGALSLQIPSDREDVEFDLASALSGFSGSDDEAEEADERSLWRSYHNALPKTGKPGFGKHGSIRILQKRLPGKGNWKFSKGNTGIKAAIHEFCREKEKDRLKGRLLRIMRNDYTTGEATLDDDDDDSEESEAFELPPAEVRVVARERNLPKQLSKEELQRLDQLLPSLPSSDPKVLMPDSPRGLGQALQRKFARLTQVPSRRKGL